MKPLVYIVEDEQDIAELIEFNLINAGYRTETIYDGDEAYGRIVDSPPDLLLLDLMLPGLSGIEICKYIRNSQSIKDLPIIMLTARSQETDTIIGLKTGADDYITKPFGIKELLARIESLLRRTHVRHEENYRNGKLNIYFSSHKITCGGDKILLTPKEFKLLEVLINSKGRVLSRLDLIEIIWKDNSDIDEHTVNVNIKRLRDKLGECHNIIKTVKGFGYKIDN